MNTHEWKPGDVAMIEVGCHANRHVAMFTDTGWRYGTDMWVTNDPAIVSVVRPVAVLDPEDREAVARLGELIRDQHQNNVFAIDDVQAALREFANPTPPKPEEPLGLGAVVEDDEGREWIRRVRKGRSPWAHYDEAERTSRGRDYDEIAAVRILSEGVQP